MWVLWFSSVLLLSSGWKHVWGGAEQKLQKWCSWLPAAVGELVHSDEPFLRWPQGQSAVKTFTCVWINLTLQPEHQLHLSLSLCVFFTGNKADEHTAGAVPEQSPCLSSDRRPLQQSGCTTCRTLPHFCCCDCADVGCRLCFLWR